MKTYTRDETEHGKLYYDEKDVRELKVKISNLENDARSRKEGEFTLDDWRAEEIASAVYAETVVDGVDAAFEQDWALVRAGFYEGIKRAEPSSVWKKSATQAMTDFEVTKSIIHECPALRLPQSFIEKLGMTAQIIALKGSTPEIASFIADACNAATESLAQAKPEQAAWASNAQEKAAFCAAIDAREASDLSLRSNAQQAELPPGWKTVVVPEDVGPEPDWEDVRHQAETATGINLPRAVFSIVIREVRRWLAAQQAEAQEPCQSMCETPCTKRKPLTIAEVEAILARWSYELHGDRARFIVRETELAHGIGAAAAMAPEEAE